jgi:hypothetical protein
LNIQKKAIHDLESYILTNQQNFNYFIDNIQQFISNEEVTPTWDFTKNS